MPKKNGMIMASFSLVVAASLLVGGANVGSAASDLESTSDIASTNINLAAADIP
ncbi:dockerin, partial [Bacillus cereus]|nr:dockerin [Bacillus cereus]